MLTDSVHVVLADLPDKARELLEMIDVDGDGSLDAGEIKSLVAALKARRRHSDDISLELFPARARQKLSKYDKDGDGSINAAELMAACDAHLREQERSKSYKRLLVVAIGLVFLLAACIVLLTGLVVKANKDTSAAGGALTGFVNGVPDSTLRCGTMMVDLGDKVVIDLGNKTESGADGKRRRLTVDVDASTVLCSTVAQYCAALAEGGGDSVSTKTPTGAVIKMRLLADSGGLCAPLLAGEAVPATAEGKALAAHAENPHVYAEDQVYFATCDRCAPGDEDDTCDLVVQAEAPEARAGGGDRQLGKHALSYARVLLKRSGHRRMQGKAEHRSA